jgi:hypothetical protein
MRRFVGSASIRTITPQSLHTLFSLIQQISINGTHATYAALTPILMRGESAAFDIEKEKSRVFGFRNLTPQTESALD